MKVDVCREFVHKIYQISLEKHPENICHQAKRCLLDYIGVTLAGAKCLEKKIESLVCFLGSQPGNVQVLGTHYKTTCELAALLNGMSSHVLELDDGIRFGMVHLGSPIISSLLAIAGAKKVSASDLINGIIVGYEAAIRLAYAIQPGHYARGYHPTSTCGAIGAAAGVSAMLSFSEKQMYDAVVAASVSSGGSLKVIESNSLLKPYNSGKAAALGVISSAMAASGFSAPSFAFDGETGFISMMTNTFNKDVLFGVKKDGYWIDKIYFKPYAACRHAHPSIEAVINIRNRYKLEAEDIKTIKIETYDSVIGKHDKKNVSDISAAKMSIPFSVAMAAVLGSATNSDYCSKNVQNRVIRKLSRNVEISANDYLSSLVPDKRSAIVSVVLDSGIVYEIRIDYPLGEPENKMSDEQIVSKFKDLSKSYFDDENEIDNIIEKVWCLESNMEQLLKKLSNY